MPKALAPKELVQVFESGEMIVLPAWDPMVRIIFSVVFLASRLLLSIPEEWPKDRPVGRGDMAEIICLI